MALNQEERIQISEKIVSIPIENKSSDDIIVELNALLVEAQKKDDTNKSLMDKSTPFVNSYQKEKGYIDGIVNLELTEQDIIDGANKILRNYFFPNDTTTILPSAADGVWKNYQSFSKSIAVGKKYTEDNDTQDNEQQAITDILADITSVEAQTDIIRVTGESCTVGAAPPPDEVAADATIQGLMTSVKDRVDELQALIALNKANITSNDPDTAKQAQNDVATDDIDNNINPALATWEAYDDFDPIGGADCPVFNGTDISTLNDTKFKPVMLTALKDALVARQAFLVTRTAQIVTNLGGIDQSLDGTLNSTSGLYGERFRFIELRLNLMAGTYNTVFSIIRAIAAQGQVKLNNENAEAAYVNVVKVSAFAAPTNGTAKVNVKDSSEFSVKDVVYVMAKNKPEIQTSIRAIDSNQITLAKNIPPGYAIPNLGRMYKDIS